MRFRALLTLFALTAFSVTPATAQRRQPTPEQRIDRLERGLRQVQKKVFPKGQPADTAGVSDDPAATQESVNSLATRLEAIERQLAEIVGQAEENGNRVGVMEAEIARLRAEQDRRLRALERPEPVQEPGADTMEPTDAADPADDEALAAPAPSRPKVEASRPRPLPAAVSTGNIDVDAEAAYDVGYQLWTAGKYDAAIKSLQAMAKKYPNHRRASWAHNLAGRALLDKGQPRAAAEALLANYRRDPKGERAQDSLFYLGQALMKLGQAGQACKAYSELEEVYGGQVRAPLKAALPNAKAEAKCG
jgi:TolA-binding protein